MALFVVAATAASAMAQESAGFALRSQIDQVVAPYVAAADFQGVVGVQRDGQAPLVLSYGLASVELEVPHRPTDIFMIGSVSKQFTAVAILLLEEDGALRTNDPVGHHLPTFGHGDEVTIEQLLTHRSGVADIYSLERFGETGGQGGTFDQVIVDLGQMELTHRPGAAYAYSNGGYAVLAAVIEQVSGESYGEFLERRLFAPLGMASSAHGGPTSSVKNRVPGYDPWGRAQLAPVVPASTTYNTGAGSLWSSADDLLTWTSALHTGRVLSDRAYAKLIRDYGDEYGYGVSVFQRFGRDVVGHDGRVAGYASDVARYVADRLTVVVLSNVQSVARDEVRRWVAAAALGEPYTVARPRVFVDRPWSAFDELLGTYAFGPGFNVAISTADGRLLARANEGGSSELTPIGKTEWFSRMLYVTVRFARDEDDAVDRLIWGEGDQAPVGRRTR